ncbi:MAG: SDR family NAD(P)-dependent oxidoreductase [Gammaproteobacteria bacterium]|nr:SDR family NAD(P)-dependent oxidoreductase [Gammaproteobacteria bacterium]NNF61614.1 SDR family NAD(P)-dependent oxidoreductase [Gammaproteobacteria bacterium]NNM21110.1 SDR family NAD(P)-dependent oxidoreductase [Gammaproteobacteria bacterium]
MILESAKAVVTGGASGLGLAVARRIIDTGGQVALLDVNEAHGESAAEMLGERAVFLRTDVSSETEVSGAVVAAAERFDGVTLAVSCAGILGAARVLGRDGPMPAELFTKVIHVNLIGTFLLARAAAQVMAENPENAEGERGVIINTASVAAYEGQIGQAAYSASKGGVVGMTLPLAREFARLGIRVMTIAPGIFHTPMMDGMPEHVRESLGAQVPFPSRLGKPEEFARMVASVYANPMLNGTTIRLDGAIRMQPK